jgi:hypothetical protein
VIDNLFKRGATAKVSLGLVFFILGVLVLVGSVGMRYVAEGGIGNKSRNQVIPKEKEAIVPTYTPEQEEMAKKAETFEFVIGENGLSAEDQSRILGFHDFVTFRNGTDSMVAVEFELMGPRTILPGEEWTRSFEQLGEFPYSVKGLAKEYNYKVKVIKK